MKKIFLDTSAYSGFKRGNPDVIESVKESDQVYLNPVVLGELLSGFDQGKFREANRQELKEFLGYPSVVLAPLTEETAERYAFIYTRLRDLGTPIPTNDLWIASSVIETGTILLTSDRHFKQVPQIQIVFF